MNPTPIIERAYELAQSGQCASVAEIDQALRAEGYRTFEELSGRDLRRRLSALCNGRGNEAAKPAERRPRRPTRPRMFA